MTSAVTPTLCRAPGVELLGRMEGSGLTEPPYLVRRADGQVVQLSRLLYLMVEHADPGTDLVEVARLTGDELELRIAPDQVRHVLEHKLAPLGITADGEGFVAEPPKVDAVLALKMRVGVVGAAAVGAAVRPLRHLFHAPVVALVVAALLAGDVWLLATGGLGDGLNHVIETPALSLVLFALSWLSLAFHEFGHAAACRYGGARPGAIGVGLYIVWPVFYSDVTESYRFGRAGRLRVDLGGIYFNGIFALAVMAAYAATGFAPLLLVVVAQHALVVNQFIPWIRLDGYYVVSDLIGVSDLFSRIGPTLRSLAAGARGRPARPAAQAVGARRGHDLGREHPRRHRGRGRRLRRGGAGVRAARVDVAARSARDPGERRHRRRPRRRARRPAPDPAGRRPAVHLLAPVHAGGQPRRDRPLPPARGRRYAPVTTSTPSGRAHPCEGAARGRAKGTVGVEDPVRASA